MRIENTRFGTIEIEDEAVIKLPAGLIGFASETQFALVEGNERLAYLVSLNTPHLAMPVIAGPEFGPSYPAPDANTLAATAQIGGEEPLVLVPVAIIDGEPDIRANLLAPIVVNATTRTGAQIVLDPSRYSASTRIAVKRTNNNANTNTMATAEAT